MRKELIAVMDKYQMNWIEGATEWGTVKTPPQISVQVCCTEEKDIITERYRFINTSDKPFFLSLTDIGIYTPFNDEKLSEKFEKFNKLYEFACELGGNKNE